MFISTPPKNSIRTIKPGDPNFKIQSGLCLTDRASIEISTNCPSRYANFILECYNNGWIKPVAHVTERELLFVGLSQE